MIFAFLTGLFYLYLNYRQYNEYQKPQNQLLQVNQICGYMWPCMFFYSRINHTESMIYVITNLLFVGTSSIYCLYMVVRFHRIAKNQEIFLKDGMIYAQLIFNSHSWSIDTLEEKDSKITATLNEVLLK